MEKKKILVTGGAGFVGSFLIDELLSRGHKVVSIDSLEEQVHRGKEPDYLNPKCEYIWGNCLDKELLRKVLHEVEVIFHLAATVGVGQSMYEIVRYTSGTTLATANLLEEVIPLKDQIKKIIVASSMSVYGEGAYADSKGKTYSPQGRREKNLKNRIWEMVDLDSAENLKPLPTSENKPLYPGSIYAINKRNQEEMFLSFGRGYNIPAVALRFFNIYGSRQALSNPYTGVAAIFSSRLLLGKEPLILEDGNQMRDFVHINDIVQGLMLSLEKESANHQVFNIGSGSPISISRVAEVLSRMITNGSIKAIVKNEYRVGDIRHCYADISKAKKFLNFNPKYTFENGVNELVDWVKKQSGVKDFLDDVVREHKAKGIIF